MTRLIIPAAQTKIGMFTTLAIADPLLPVQLIGDHKLHQAATARFPPEIFDSCVRIGRTA